MFWPRSFRIHPKLTGDSDDDSATIFLQIRIRKESVQLRQNNRRDGMLKSFTQAHGWVEGIDVEAVWTDLVNPLPEETVVIEKMFSVKIPTKAKVQEIETSSRLYEEGGCWFLTTILPVVDLRSTLRLESVTFILSRERLYTLRYEDFPLRDSVLQRYRKVDSADPLSSQFFLLSLGVIIDEIADLLERLLDEIDRLSRDIFHRPDPAQKLPKAIVTYSMTRIGVCGESVLLLRETLVGIGRLVGFISKESDSTFGPWGKSELKTIEKDISALTDHVSFASNRITFLLNAVLGFVNIRQNDIIKILSVVSVVFLPPTLLASAWGMNFRFMPELGWPIGYPLALLLIIISGALPYLYCKKHQWL